MATVTERDRDLAVLLGHKPTDDMWKQVLFTFAHFREDTQRLAHTELREELKKARAELAQSLLAAVDTSVKAAGPKEVQGIAWVLFAAVHRLVKATSIESAMYDADLLLSGYTKRFCEELNHDQTRP